MLLKLGLQIFSQFSKLIWKLSISIYGITSTLCKTMLVSVPGCKDTPNSSISGTTLGSWTKTWNTQYEIKTGKSSPSDNAVYLKSKPIYCTTSYEDISFLFWWKEALMVHYTLANSGMTRKHVYRFHHTTSREQLIYDECIVNQLLRACLLGQTNNLLVFF